MVLSFFPYHVNWSRYFRDNHELCVNIIAQRGCSAYVSPRSWRFFFFFGVFFLRGSQSNNWVTATRMLKRGRNRKRHRPLPSPLPHRFLFRPRFCFRAVVSLTLRNTKHKRKTQQQQQQKPPATHRKLCICLGVSNKGERRDRTGFSISKAREMLRPCWNKFYRKSNRLDISKQHIIWGGVKWFQHRLSTTLLKRICLNNLESVRPRLF